jgi:type II secretory pathway pseudopilin PulG
MDEGIQGPEADNGLSKLRSKKGIGCLLALLVLVGFLVLVFGPGFVEYRREQSLNRRIYKVAESIRTALENYAQNHPDHRYPDTVADYQALRDLVNKHGGLLPESPSDAHIIQIRYTSDEGTDYELIVTLDLPERSRRGRSLRVTPEGVIRYE